MILKNLEFQAALRVIPIINIKILSANFTFISFEISSDFVVIKPLSVFKCIALLNVVRCFMGPLLCRISWSPGLILDMFMQFSERRVVQVVPLDLLLLDLRI